MGTPDEDDYQQLIDPTLRDYQHFPTSLSTPPHTPSSKKVPTEYSQQGFTSSSTSLPRDGGLKIHSPNPYYQPGILPPRNLEQNIQTRLHRSTSSASLAPASPPSPSDSNPTNPQTTTLNLSNHLSTRRPRLGPNPSLQDLKSASIKHAHPLPIPTGYLPNSIKSPASYSAGHQTDPTTISHDFQGEKDHTSQTFRSQNQHNNNNNRLEFGEQWMINNENYENNQLSEEDAKPNNKISADLDYSLRRLINLDVFRKLLEDPTSRRAFRQAIILGLSPSSSSAAPPSVSLTKLDLWLDCRGVNQILNLLKIGTHGLIDVYLKDPDSRHALHAILPDSMSIGGGAFNSLLSSINRLQLLANEEQEDEQNDDRIGTDRDGTEEEGVVEGGVASTGGLKAIENRLLISLYQNEFPLFIKKNLVSNVVVKLGKFNLNESDRDGLGDCFCLTNPRLRDHPIVLVSDGFTKVTGYERQAIVGKNCRFLQGPGTSPESVQRIRDGLNSGEGCTELLLNYRKDGTPFYCLLCIIPFRDVTGALIYFIGGQINVTGMLSSQKGLSFLMANNEDAYSHGTNELSRSTGRSAGRSTDDLLDHVGLSQHSFSPTMQHFAMRGHPTNNVSEQTTSSRDLADSTDVRGNPTMGGEYHAAGSITFDDFDPNFGKDNSAFRAKSSSFFRRLAGIHHRDPTNKNLASPYLHSPSTSSKKESQKLLGAETLFHEPKPLSDHIKQFESTYSHLLVFQQDSRRVIFATKEAIALFGLNHSNSKEIYKSKLIQTDFLELVWPVNTTNKESVATLRAHLKKIIKAFAISSTLSTPPLKLNSVLVILCSGLPISFDCQVKSIQRGFFLSITKEEDPSKLVTTRIHLTPLMDKDGKIVAYVCLFG
ncbi:hypothetical protein PGT21_011388 [Puccinia graminis f. sp. tritici]|uniref:PAS domain-containing protein n=1 Tax=Puccinia graminis f. sp. tritici TaxID=56615 RepID=A0A5B0NBY9_PUCGR|nr:hypothetical protein PGT21_011388 [Puccinia graminis f. sp. tritici]